MEKKRRSSAHGALPSDLTFELLLRLPSKSLWRFHCVCKSWYALISDPYFGKQHRARSLPNPALLTCESVYDDPEGENVIFCVSSFDSEGTLVNQFTKRGPCYNSMVFSICRDLLLTCSFVCNLSTQEVVVTLPRSYHGLALVHMPSTNEFKLLAHDDSPPGRFKVLTLGTDQWRDVDAPPCRDVMCGAFANGAVHVVMEDHNEIGSFNLEREEWGVLAAAPPLSPRHCNLRELNGYLCILDIVDKQNSMDIWLLKDYDKGLWAKEYTICLSSLLMADGYWVEAEPLLIEDDGKLLLQVNSYVLQLYAPKTKISREIQDFEEVQDPNTFHIKCFSSLGHRAS